MTMSRSRRTGGERLIHIVLPTYNEEAGLARLLERIEAAMAESRLGYRIVLVDDGSTDRTRDIAAGFASRLPMDVHRHDANQGLGSAIRDGLRLAVEGAADGDVVVTMDADDTHGPELIPQMLQLIDQGRHVVIASRYRPGSRSVGVPPQRRALAWAASSLFRLVLPIPGVRDYTCGYRAYRAQVIQQALAEYGQDFVEQDGFQCMVDILLKLRRRPLVFGEVPVVLRYDLKGGGSKMRVWKTATATLGLLLRRRLGG